MKNITSHLAKVLTVLIVVAALSLSYGVTAMASPLETNHKICAKAAEDEGHYRYNVGDYVEVKIDRGYFTVKCQVLDRKYDWFNGPMYYVTPVGELNFAQNLFVGEGWYHETEIQITNPQPYINFAVEKILGWLL